MASFVGDTPTVKGTQIIVRERGGIVSYNGPNDPILTPADRADKSRPVYVPSISKSDTLKLGGEVGTSPLYTPDGTVLCVIYEKKNLCLYNTDSGEQLFELPISNVLRAEFSPQGTYLVTYSNPSKGMHQLTEIATSYVTPNPNPINIFRNSRSRSTRQHEDLEDWYRSDGDVLLPEIDQERSDSMDRGRKRMLPLGHE